MANTRPKDFALTRVWPAVDDYLGLDGLAGGTAKFLASSVYGVQGAAIASAATVNLANITGNFVDVTGTTTITSFGTVAAGIRVWIRFTGVLTITNNNTSLILPDATSIVTSAGDIGCFVSIGSGNWVCLTYRRQNNPPLAYASNAQVQTGTSMVTAVAPGTLKPRESMMFALTTETGNATALAPAVVFRMPYAFRIAPNGARANVRTAPTGAKLIFDIKAGGVSIFTTDLLSIDATELTSTTAAIAANITNFDLTDDQAMAIDVTQIGSTLPGQGVKVTLLGNRV